MALPREAARHPGAVGLDLGLVVGDAAVTVQAPQVQGPPLGVRAGQVYLVVDPDHLLSFLGRGTDVGVAARAPALDPVVAGHVLLGDPLVAHEPQRVGRGGQFGVLGVALVAGDPVRRVALAAFPHGRELGVAGGALGRGRVHRARDRDEQAQARQRDQALAKLKTELESARSQLSASQARVAALEAQLHEREKTLAEQKETLARLQKESEQWKQKLKQLESQRQVAAASPQSKGKGKARSGGIEPPKIELIEPRLVAVRSGGKVMIPVKRGLKKRTIIGRVDAPAGLYALTLNGARIKADPEGLFETDILVAGDRTPVNLVAIDRRGRRSTLSFEMVVQRSGKITARKLIPLKPDEVGRFYALVIGNQHYKYLPSLDTSINDAKAVAKVLKEKFGYKVTLLLDATRYQILSELNKLRKKLTDKDNLLIYYAGHGELDRVNLRGQWLPVDAEAGNTANWISNISITDILNAMAARHILLVADSCYSGTLTRSALTDIEAGKTEEERLNWFKTLAKMRSRTALTSGGLAPVLDGGGGDHSVFAKAFLDSLASLDDISEGQKVYREVAARVAYVASRYQVEQVPQYAPIKYAGHEAGDYIFIPEDLL